MAPSELRRQTLREMRKALLAMMSPKFDLALEGRPRAQITEAATTLLSLQRSRLRLANARLRDIRDDLIANEKALLKGMTSLRKALKRLNDVQRVVKAVTELARTVGNIVNLAV